MKNGLQPGTYIVRRLNVNPSNPDKLELLSRPLPAAVVETELAWHRSEHPDHAVFVITVGGASNGTSKSKEPARPRKP